MDEQDWTLQHRVAVFLGLRDEDLTTERLHRRQFALGVVLILCGAFILTIEILNNRSVMPLVVGAGFVIIGTITIVRRRSND